MNMQSNLVHTPPTIILPAEIIDIIDNFYDDCGDLVFQPISVLLELSKLDLFKSTQAALEIDDWSATADISIGISNAVAKHNGRVSLFDTGAAGDLMFYLDGLVAFHQSMMESPQSIERWIEDPL